MSASNRSPKTAKESLKAEHEERQADVLGCVILAGEEGDHAKANALFGQLHARDFTDYRAQQVFRALTEIRSAEKPINLVELDSQLRLNKSNGVTISNWAVGLPNRVPVASVFPSNLTAIRNAAAKLALADDLRAFHDSVVSGAIDGTSIARILEGAATEARKEAEVGLQERVKARRFSVAAKPPQPDPRFLLAGVPIATPGNLVAISAAAKAGKSSFLSAAIASVIAPDPSGRDFLGAHSSNPDGFAVLHFDTEQSPFDHWQMISRSLHRAGVADAPNWLGSYCLTGFPFMDARSAIDCLADEASKECGGIHSILIDGVADLVADVNDPEECNALVAHLHAQAIRLHCPIFGVIHVNPGSEKTRGHLGSQLERKSETNLRLEKEGETVVVYSEKNRGAPILKTTAPRFAWSDAHKMHVSVESLGVEKDAEKRRELLETARELFKQAGKSALSWSEVHEGIVKIEGLKMGGARKRFAAMKALAVLREGALSTYILNP